MDTKNVVMAIVLSTLVLIFWATFFEPPIDETKISKEQSIEKKEKSSPSIEDPRLIKKVSRDESLKNVDRINLENSNIKGSISLGVVLLMTLHLKIIMKNFMEKKKLYF